MIKTVPSGYLFHLLAANGQCIAVSEVYETRAACHRGIQSVVKSAPNARMEDMIEDGIQAANPKFELFRDKAGGFRFRLKARNGKVIAVSEGYTTKAACEGGIESVRKNVSDAAVEE